MFTKLLFLLSIKFPSLIQINPQHTVPTLVDEGEAIWDSHAICAYLVDKYGQGEDSLYPSDLIQRARVQQRLHFDSGVLFSALRAANVSIFLGGSEVPEEALNAISAGYDLLETFLETDEYLVGNSLTVADFCCITSITTMDYHVPIEADKYPKILAWIERVSTLPYFYEINTEPVETLRAFLDKKKEENKAAAE